MTQQNEIVFLFDVDNTLLDNDRVTADLRRYLEQMFGPEVRDRYFTIFEELRAELGYADYLGTLQRYRLEAMCDPKLLMMSDVQIEGRAETSTDSGDLKYWATRIAGRYMGADQAEAYGRRNSGPGELLVRVKPVKTTGEKDIAGW